MTNRLTKYNPKISKATIVIDCWTPKVPMPPNMVHLLRYRFFIWELEDRWWLHS